MVMVAFVFFGIWNSKFCFIYSSKPTFLERWYPSNLSGKSPCFVLVVYQGLVPLRLLGYEITGKVGFQLQKKQNLEFQIPKKATITIW